MYRALLLLFSTVGVWTGGTYVDPDRSFELKVPAGYRVRTGTGAEKASDSYIPVCHPESSVCFEYPAGRYRGTTFGSASVEVFVSPAITKEDCVDPAEEVDRSGPMRQIDHIEFTHTRGGGAAMSHDVEFDRYWGFHNGTCFELAAAVTYTNLAVYDPGAIKEFTQRDKAKVADELKAILGSFRALR